MTQASGGLQAGGRAETAWALAAILAAAAVVFAAGATSDIVKGDEVYHYSFARSWAEAGLTARPTHNQIFPRGEPPGYYYVSEALWGLGFAVLAQVGGAREWLAQLYQAGWYGLLLGLIYLAGKRLFGPRGGLAALLVSLSVPMFAAFGVMLYVDVPATAMCMLTLILLLRKRVFWAGLAMGLVYLTKRNGFFLAGPFVLWIAADELLSREGPIWKRLVRAALSAATFAVPMIAVVLPDFFWRRSHLPISSDPATNLAHMKSRMTTFLANQQLSSNLNNPLKLLEYFGAVFPLLVLAYVFRRAWRRAGRAHGWLWVCLLLYMAAIAVFFTLDTDIRYVMPAAPLAVLAMTRGLHGWYEKRWVLAVLALAGLATLVTTAGFVKTQRRLTPGQRAVFEYLRTETPEGTLVLYPGEVLMARARRPVVWAHMRDSRNGQPNLRQLMLHYEPEQILENLRANAVAYVCVDRAMVYDDSRNPRLGGYPLSFVRKLERMPSVEKVPGDWPGIELWKVKDDPGPAAPGPGEAPAPD